MAVIADISLLSSSMALLMAGTQSSSSISAKGGTPKGVSQSWRNGLSASSASSTEGSALAAWDVARPVGAWISGELQADTKTQDIKKIVQFGVFKLRSLSVLYEELGYIDSKPAPIALTT